MVQLGKSQGLNASLTATFFPMFNNSSDLPTWFVREEAPEYESLKDEELINGISSTVSCFLPQWQHGSSSNILCTGNVNSEERYHQIKSMLKFSPEEEMGN